MDSKVKKCVQWAGWIWISGHNPDCLIPPHYDAPIVPDRLPGHFSMHQNNSIAYYSHAIAQAASGKHPKPSAIDVGNYIGAWRSINDDDMLAVLMVAYRRWSPLYLSGNANDMVRAIKIAMSNNIPVVRRTRADGGGRSGGSRPRPHQDLDGTVVADTAVTAP